MSSELHGVTFILPRRTYVWIIADDGKQLSAGYNLDDLTADICEDGDAVTVIRSEPIGDSRFTLTVVTSRGRVGWIPSSMIDPIILHRELSEKRSNTQ